MTLDAVLPSNMILEVQSKSRLEFAGGISSLRNSWGYISPLPFDTMSLQEVSVSVRGDTASVSLKSESDVGSAKWLNQTIVALVRLIWLPRDWNSDNPKRIKPKTVERIIALLLSILDPDSTSPMVVPTTQGGIQVEWHQNEIDLEIEAESSGKLEFFFSGPKGDKEGTIEGNPAIILKQFIHYLKASPTP